METINPYASPMAHGRHRLVDQVVHRLRFWLVFLMASSTTILVGTPIVILGLRFGVVRWSLLTISIVIALMMQAIVIRLQRVTVSADLIRCADFWGRNRTIAIDSIHRVTPAGSRPFRFLRLHYETHRRPLWLPLFIHRRSDFWDFIHQNVRTDSVMSAVASAALTEGESFRPREFKRNSATASLRGELFAQ